ncbi:hypothetical protein JCM5296_000444, partial [Sporobolomyces johnsonii]
FFFTNIQNVKVAHLTRSATRRYDLPLVDPSSYPEERRRRRPAHPLEAPSSDDEISSSSETDAPTFLVARRTVTVKMPNPTSLAAAAASYQPGKAPVLFDVSPAGLTSFSRAAKLFFRSKSVKEDEDKIAYVGAGLGHFPELHNWYLSSATTHEAKKYDDFLLQLQKRALPRDFVWEAKGRIRTSRQGERDYEEWADEMRTEHLALTEKVLSGRDFVECLLYGMDVELSIVLRQGTALKGSGLHQDELST